MKKKIVMQKGYPTTDGVMHATYAEAMSHQARIDLAQAVEDAPEGIGTIEFIEKNSSAVLDFIKYAGKPKAAPKKRAAKKKPAKTEAPEQPATCAATWLRTPIN